MIRIQFLLRIVPDNAGAGLKPGGQVWINPAYIVRIVERGELCTVVMSDGSEYLTRREQLMPLLPLDALAAVK